jgi:hypothetical protein
MHIIGFYLLAFVVALRMFLQGFHDSAYMLLVGAFLLLSVWSWRRRCE